MEKVMNGNKYNPEETNLNPERQYNPNIEKKYERNPLKQGKSDEAQELDAKQNRNEDLDEEDEEEEE